MNDIQQGNDCQADQDLFGKENYLNEMNKRLSLDRKNTASQIWNDLNLTNFVCVDTIKSCLR